MSQDVQTGLVAGTWNIDLSHSEAGFTVRHLMSKVRGSFTDFSGTITTAENILDSSVEVTIKSSSITTHNEQRDAHLRSADFFDPTKGGELRFVSTGITESGDGYVITGDLTINGITKSVDLAADFLGVEADPCGSDQAGRRGHHHDQPQGLRRQLEPGAGERQVPGRRQGRDHARRAGHQGLIPDWRAAGLGGGPAARQHSCPTTGAVQAKRGATGSL